MRIKNNPKIFYLACGLLVAGDRQYDQADAEVAALVEKIQETAVDADILQWFDLEKAHDIMVSTLLVEDGQDFDVDRIMVFLSNVNRFSPIDQEGSRKWLARLPEILTYLEGVFRGFWKEYCALMFARTNSWMPEIEASRKLLKEFFGRENIPGMMLAANLFASSSVAGFLRLPDGTVCMIGSRPDIEGMLQEVMRPKLMPQEYCVDIMQKGMVKP